MKEVKLGRYAGPFHRLPFNNYIQSPIGLVLKDGGKKTRLIFHLSYPRNGDSVNTCIPDKLCSVRYPDFEQAIQLCQRTGKFCYVSKSDMSSAFRHLPIKASDFMLLVMKAKDPKTGKTFYFVDKCLPFGSSISCAIFQEFSNAVAHLVVFRVKKPNINYLDDYLFVAMTKQMCNEQIEVFIEICSQIKFPVALDKTEWAVQIIVFLGLLIDNINQVICIPVEKLEKAKVLINEILGNKKRKATILQIQRLAGFLNFLCKCIVPGRAFTTCLYALTAGKLKPYHHVKIPSDVIQDLLMWKEFIEQPQAYCRPFIDFNDYSADDILMYSDASKNPLLGFGAICENDWMVYRWGESKICHNTENYNFVVEENPSIAFLELFAVTAGVIEWIHHFKNRRIFLFCDNESAVHMINNQSSKCRNCMMLLRIITLQGMTFNVRIFAKHVRSETNVLSDALSRGQMNRFWANTPKSMNAPPTEISDKIWLIQKFWQR